MRVLFLAEAPPGRSHGYFYDPAAPPGYRETLRRSLFGLLEITGSDTRAKLAEFKRRGYFLADSVKCRCKKRGGQPPPSVTRTCSRKWLQEELEELGKPTRICVLGRSALRALSHIRSFEELASYSVTQDCGKVIAGEWAEVLIWPFLSSRNKRTCIPHLEAFRSFCYVDGASGSQSNQEDDGILEILRSQTEETVRFLSEEMKPDRERAS